MMKHLLYTFAALIVLGGGFGTNAALGQPSRVAFVNQTHSKIYFTDGTKLDSTTVLDTATINTTLRAALFSSIVSISKISTLAATSDGKTMIIAAHILFPNRTTTLQDSADAILQIQSPFIFSAITDLNTKLRILKRINPPINNVNLSIPTATIAANDLDWYATWTSSQVGSPALWFFHGHLNETDDGTATHIDSVEYPTDASHMIQGDYHMSNLAASPAGDIMLAIIVDQLSNQVNGPDFHAVRWEPHPSGPTQVFRSSLFTSSVQGKFNVAVTRRDFNFGLAMRTISPDIAQIVLAKDSLADLQIESYGYNNTNIVLTDGPTIARSMLPASEYFFDALRSEVDANARQRGNAGDLMFIGQSDSIVFVTHSAPDDINLAPSKLRIATLSSASSQVLFGDGKHQPLHPIWLQGIVAAPPKHEYVTLSTQQVDFGTVETAKNVTRQVTISNPSDSDVRVDSIVVTGPNKADFTVSTSPNNPAFNLPKSATATMTITFAPKDTAGVRNAMLTVYFGGHADSLRQLQLGGNAKLPVWVAESPLAQHLMIAPNPMQTSAKVSFTPLHSGAVHAELRDVLGREIYRIEPMIGTVGQTLSFTIERDAASLAAGSYYLQIHSAGESVVRQIVVLK